MKKTWYVSSLAILVFAGLFFSPVDSHAAGFCRLLNGTPPTIDGTISSGEWPTAPQFILNTPTYPIRTNVYCMNDSTDLYILVDALGDTTDDDIQTPCSSPNHVDHCDECLLVFGDADQTSTYTAEVWGKSGIGGIVGQNSHFPAGAEVAIGFSNHRFYEWKIPLSSINAVPGQNIDFSSPQLCKGVGTGDPCFYHASMPYDGSTGHDNGWPLGVDVANRSTWTQMRLNDPLGIPTLSEWGMIIFTILAGLGAIFYLRRQKRAEN